MSGREFDDPGPFRKEESIGRNDQSVRVLTNHGGEAAVDRRGSAGFDREEFNCQGSGRLPRDL